MNSFLNVIACIGAVIALLTLWQFAIDLDRHRYSVAGNFFGACLFMAAMIWSVIRAVGLLYGAH